MSVFEKLHPASFRNVAFLVSTESVTRGKKTVTHEYPNSDQRYVEELGKLPPTFSISAIVHGEDAINHRLRLENVLELPGIGLLVHPIYGNLNVKSLSFSVNSNQTEVGVFVFDIQFATSRENITPTPDSPTNPTISSLAGNAKDAANDRLQSLYKPPSTPSVFDSVVDTIENVFDTVHETINTVVNKSSQGAAKFDRVYRSVTRNISMILSSAETLRENITLLYDTALDVPLFVDQLSAAWDNLTDYPLTVATSSPLTSYQRERDQNNNAIIEHLKLTSLANSYEAKSYVDYTTDTELYDASQRLNEAHKSFFNAQNEDIDAIDLESIANDIDVRSSFAQLRVTTNKIFDEKEKVIYRITNISPGLTSMALTSYRYYGNIDLLSKIITLNESINVANFSKTIKALTE